MADLHICTETFTGELVEGRPLVYVEGVTVLDPSDADDAAALRVFGKYFKPVRPAARKAKEA